MTEHASSRARENRSGREGGGARPAHGLGEDGMRHFLTRLSWTAALAAAVLTAAVGTWQELSVFSLALRCLTAGLLVFGFLRGGGELAARAVLRSLAEHQLRQEEERRLQLEKEKKEREARRAEAQRTAQRIARAASGQDARDTEQEQTKETGSGEKVSEDRKAA